MVITLVVCMLALFMGLDTLPNWSGREASR